ncbi:hypothetical protein CDAR_503721 [Caerostris darwini]|uniref:C2H2-type domain-containing protein n=1 Tax=Caerostris darwini TaxID=1538125 RepID=A0AAV4TKW1_9ARAC|nr:hypothetical protein CDAR_503721 [Caerostris darwini]
MEIRNCEFFNAYVTNFEVHSCRTFGKQHRQCVVTLPRSSSGNIAQDIDLRTQQMHYEERVPSMNQTNSSRQHIIIPNMHQRTNCEDTAAAEVSSQYGIANQNPFNLEVSDCLSPGMAHGEENQTESAYPLQPSDDNSTIVNQNLHYCEDWYPNPPVEAPMSVAEPCFLPGFQETFGHRNPLRNQFQHLNVSSQVECSGTYPTDEMSSHFASNSNESDNTSNNQLFQHYETPLGMPILSVQNAQYNPMDPIPPTDAIRPIHSNKCPEEFPPKDNIEPHDSSRGHARPYACKYCDKTFSYSWRLSSHIRTHTGEKLYKCTVCNKCCTQSSHLTSRMRIHNRKTLHKCTKCSECLVSHSRLEEHFSSVHPGKKLHKCMQCDKCFSRPSKLRRHFSSVHTDDRPYKCTECGKCFALASNLKRHMRLHNKV